MNQSALKIVSWCALAATIVPSLMSFLGVLSLNMVSLTALIGTIVWFAATPFWMGREKPVDANKAET